MFEEKSTKTELIPANLEKILERYGHLLAVYPELNNGGNIYSNLKRTNKRLDILFPLRKHPIHGVTGLHAIEKYDESGYVKRYHYQWRVIVPRSGINISHISSWGNDPHNAEWTPEEFKVKTEPHHHHFDPNDRKKRRENYNVRTLEQAFKFISYYIESGKEYKCEAP